MPPLTPSATPGKPAVIRIEGLDDGPREIPFREPQPWSRHLDRGTLRRAPRAGTLV